MQDSAQIAKLVEAVITRVMLEKKRILTVPVGISNRHIHISPEDLEKLFGPGHQLTKLKDLKQPGEFAAQETVILIGPKGIQQNVRILGPTRKQTQVEISRTDAFNLGVQAVVRESGKIEGTPGITIVGPYGAATLQQGVICALRHIHMTTTEAESLGLKDRSMVKVRVPGERETIFSQVLLRVSEDFLLEMHVDTDEANAAWIKNNDQVELILD